MGAGLTKQIKENISFSTTELSSKETRPSLLKCVLVLLHGLTMDASECNAIKKTVEDQFEKVVEIIQPKCREEWASARLSIDEQARKVVSEVKEILRTSYSKYSEEERKALPINIFGYSQGELVACILADNYGHELKIKAVISAFAPVSGTDVFENSRSDVNAFNEKAKPGLGAIGHPKTSLAEAKALGMILNTPVVQKVAHVFFQSVSDMRIHATCTADIKAFIREGKHKIPILLIAGYIDNFSECFDFEEEDNEQVNTFAKAYAKLTTGQEDGAHDILIPVKRQLCRIDSFENLATSKDDPVYPYNVRRYIAKETIHCYNLTPILSDFQVNHGKTLFESEKTIAAIIDFIGQHNNLSIER
ncbi:hypothetical protein [Cardinium endosymbiont of Oedothorax gibbosus]|uniref:hypothetical protein n=1 Tax=Cardinium endosymbiont of Oedothorax gibbosus TaxID=931101 RepID=UPI002025182B|nr:hypothetical protein [Cardinium endosymbiont of Oedothorax gibbosus]CAH2559799.1 Alpha/Beta hydrolase fold superfamily protein [Cardinium endosymbiont of Oedothorax gibbosus]